MVTIRQIAEELDLSISTVSRALKDSPQIPERTKERVRTAADRLGYQRHAQAAALRTGSTHMLGLVVSSIDNPFFGKVAARVEEAAAARGYRLMVAHCGEDHERQDEMLSAMMEYRVDGLIFVPMGTPEDRVMQRLRTMPVVTIDRQLEGSGIASVGADSWGAARELAAHIRSQGFERPALISGPQTTSTGLERDRCLRSSLMDVGYENIPGRKSSYTIEGGRAAARELFTEAEEQGTLPDVLICSSAPIAIGAMTECAERGIRVGQQIGMATFDELDWFQAITPTMTAIDTRIPDMARESVNLLLSLIAGETAPDQLIRLPSRLCLRDSTRALSAHH